MLCATILGRVSDPILPLKFSDGLVLRVDPRCRTTGGLFFDGSADADDLAFLQACSLPGGVVFDIGANIGLVAIPLARYLAGIGGRLYAFEPIPPNADVLSSNIHVNRLENYASVIRLALSNEIGNAHMAREARNGASTGNALLERAAAGEATWSWVEVRVSTLDREVERLGIDRIDLIKIDVEGAEGLVLAGGMHVLQKLRPVIYGEFNSGLMPKFGQTFADVGHLVEPLGYRAFAFQARLDPVPVEFVAGRGNAILCPVEKIPALTAACRSARSQ